MALPTKPKISGGEEKAKGLESFINGDKPIQKESTAPTEKAKTTTEDMSIYLLKLPQELHKQTKIICVEKGISMKDYIIEAITEKNNKTSK